MTVPIVFSSLSAGQAEADREVLALLERDELPDVGELVGVERVLGEPLVDDDRQRSAALHEGIGVGQGALRGTELVEGGEPQGLLRLHDDHRRPCLAGHRLGQRPEQVAAIRAGIRRLRRCAHDHQLVVRRLLDDRLAHARRLADEPGRPAHAGVLTDEGVDRGLLALDGPRADALRHDVQHHDLRPEALGEVAADAHGELGVGPAADRHEDRAHMVDAALLDDREVARRLADHRIDRRAEHRPRPGVLAGERHLGGLRLGPRGLRRRRRAAPAEDDEVRSPPPRPPRSRRRRHDDRCGPGSGARRPPRRRTSSTRWSRRREVRAWVAPS